VFELPEYITELSNVWCHRYLNFILKETCTRSCILEDFNDKSKFSFWNISIVIWSIYIIVDALKLIDKKFKILENIYENF